MSDPYQSPGPTVGQHYGQHDGEPTGGQTGQYPGWQQPVRAPGPRQGNGLAITALVLSILAMLMVIGLGIFTAIGFFGSPVGYMLSGTAPQVVAGEAYPGKRLEAEIGRVIDDDGGIVDSLQCPVSVEINADVETTCTGQIDGLDSRAVVTFEDDEGHFTLSIE